MGSSFIKFLKCDRTETFHGPPLSVPHFLCTICYFIFVCIFNKHSNWNTYCSVVSYLTLVLPLCKHWLRSSITPDNSSVKFIWILPFWNGNILYTSASILCTLIRLSLRRAEWLSILWFLLRIVYSCIMDYFFLTMLLYLTLNIWLIFHIRLSAGSHLSERCLDI